MLKIQYSQILVCGSMLTYDKVLNSCLLLRLCHWTLRSKRVRALLFLFSVFFFTNTGKIPIYNRYLINIYWMTKGIHYFLHSYISIIKISSLLWNCINSARVFKDIFPMKKLKYIIFFQKVHWSIMLKFENLWTRQSDKEYSTLRSIRHWVGTCSKSFSHITAEILEAGRSGFRY